jgi:hypothetical protein
VCGGFYFCFPANQHALGETLISSPVSEKWIPVQRVQTCLLAQAKHSFTSSGSSSLRRSRNGSGLPCQISQRLFFRMLPSVRQNRMQGRIFPEGVIPHEVMPALQVS